MEMNGKSMDICADIIRKEAETNGFRVLINDEYLTRQSI